MRLLLDSWPEKPAILCFPEHWLPSDHLKKKNSVVLVRKRTIPIERSPPVSEASANFSGFLVDHLIHINIDQYKLADKYSRNSDKHEGSCIFVLNKFKLRELPNITNLGKDKVFEISAIELVVLKVIVVCVYRSPMSSTETFLELLEVTINKISKKGFF
jgi:hypothetical protein